MAAKDDLPNKTLVRLSHDISTVSMRAIAVIYMDFEQHTLETIMDENGGNQSRTNTDIFNRWKRRGYHNNKQVPRLNSSPSSINYWQNIIKEIGYPPLIAVTIKEKKKNRK